MIYLFNAIFALDPSIVCVRGEEAFDIDGNEVAYDKAQAQAKLAEMQSAEAAAIQAQADSKQTALNKLMALGLTEEEALALGK